jgi:predicted phosphoribosyltransferase
VVATPVAPPETVSALHADADDVIAVATPAGFGAVGQFYDHFPQVSDDEVARLLADEP